MGAAQETFLYSTARVRAGTWVLELTTRRGMLTYLKGQFRTRATGRGWKFPTAGMEYCSNRTKKLLMKKGGVGEANYQIGLLELVIAAELQSYRAAQAVQFLLFVNICG